MKKGNWLPIDKRIVNLLPKNREYSFIEAYLSLSLDIDSGKNLSINSYARIWGWSRNKVRHFVEGLRTGSGHIVDRKGTGSGQEIRLIINGLRDVSDNKRTTIKND